MTALPCNTRCVIWITNYTSQIISLLWRHNGGECVSNHQPHSCLHNRSFGRRTKKTWKLRVTGLCVGNSPKTGEFPAQIASNAEMFPFDDFIMIGHRKITLPRICWQFHKNQMIMDVCVLHDTGEMHYIYQWDNDWCHQFIMMCVSYHKPGVAKKNKNIYFMGFSLSVPNLA